MTGIDSSKMSIAERARLRLHELYRRYGYSRYKMDKFEEYEFYLRYKDFLETESIIAFSDANGRLMALKPDLTLSMVKNFRYTAGCVQKQFYSENVYRSSKANRMHREIMQTGLECMGDLDVYQLAEVTLIAAMSLATVSDEYVLQVSHMGLVRDLMDSVSDEDVRKDLIRCLGEKNRHEMKAICEEQGIGRNVIEALETLISTYGYFDEIIGGLEAMPLGEEGRNALEELRSIFAVIDESGLSEKVKIDFSIVNDMTYYSGILFQGFVNGVPQSVLSGGRYDKLVERMGRQGGAVGFAVYLDYLDLLELNESKNDVDVVLIYNQEDEPAAVYRAASAIREGGEEILIERNIPSRMTFGKVVQMVNGVPRELSGEEIAALTKTDHETAQRR